MISYSLMTLVPFQARHRCHSSGNTFICQQKANLVPRPEIDISVVFVWKIGGPVKTVEHLKQSSQKKWVNYLDTALVCVVTANEPRSTYHWSASVYYHFVLWLPYGHPMSTVILFSSSCRRFHVVLALSTYPTSHLPFHLRIGAVTTIEGASDTGLFDGQLHQSWRKFSEPHIFIPQSKCELFTLWFLSLIPDLVLAIVIWGLVRISLAKMHKKTPFNGIFIASFTGSQYCTGIQLTWTFPKNILFATDHTEDELVYISLEVTEVGFSRIAVLLFSVFNSYLGTAKAYLISKFLLLCSLAQGKRFIRNRKRTLKTKHADLLWPWMEKGPRKRSSIIVFYSNNWNYSFKTIYLCAIILILIYSIHRVRGGE